jgi:hypothetical protein
MTKDDVICMASKAGLTVGTNMSGIGLVGSPADIGIAHITLDQMHHFADIVEAAEREACAVIAFNARTYIEAAEAIRARGQDD